MKTWIIITPDALANLQAINSMHNILKATPTTLTDGRMILPASMASDIYWIDWRDVLSGLTQETFDAISLLPPSPLS